MNTESTDGLAVKPEPAARGAADAGNQAPAKSRIGRSFEACGKRPCEVRLLVLRETPVEKPMGDTPESIASYMRAAVTADARFNPDVECLYVAFLNTRRRVTGYMMVGMGTLNAIQTHAREVFRAAIVAAADAIVLVHNHPSGETAPSDGDIKVTREMIAAGKLLKIELLDHVILGDVGEGKRGWSSLRELGYFYN
jgi:DNA repair protein RadC